MYPQENHALKIVLVETSHPGNVGAAARAMKNMGQHQMVLVNPQYDTALKENIREVYARASGADDVLDNAIICNTLEEALADCHFVAMTTARSRHASRIYADSRQAAEIISEKISQKTAGERAALVFGPERTGLSNEDLDKSHLCVFIPTSEFSSLNVSMAVNLMCYEIFMCQYQRREVQVSHPAALENLASGSEPVAQVQSMEGFYQHCQSMLHEIDFFKGKPAEKLMRKIRHIFQRSRLSEDEVLLLRGIFSRVMYQCQKIKNKE